MCDDLAAFTPGAGSHVDDVVRLRDHPQTVLDDIHRIACVHHLDALALAINLPRQNGVRAC
jgi:hypothetical protein